MPPYVSLPFLVVHGALVWKLLLVALSVLSARLTLRRTVWRVRLLAALPWSLFWCGVLYIVGQGAVGSLEKTSGPPHLAELSEASIASAMPGSREEALRVLGHSFDRAGTRTSLAYAFAIARVRGECPADVLERASQLDAALFYARQCANRDEVAWILERLGRYNEAAVWATTKDHSQLPLVLATLTGHWQFAARLAERDAIRWPTAQERDELCLSYLFRVWDGDPSARASLNAVASSSTKCAAIGALLLPPEQQVEALSMLQFDDSSTEMTFCLLAGGCSDIARHGSELLRRFSRTEMLWVEVESSPAHFHEDASARSMLTGHFELARDELRVSVKNGVHPNLAFEDYQEIELRSGATGLTPREVTSPELAAALRLRAGMAQSFEDLFVVSDERCPAFESAVRNAARGDGRELVRALRTCPIHWFEPESTLVLGVLPNVKIARDELAQELRYYRDEFMPDRFTWIPAEMLTHAALYRDMANLIGDGEEAARWQDVVDRNVDVLSEPRRAMAMLILQTYD